MNKYKVSSKSKNLLLNMIDFLGGMLFFIPNSFPRKKIKNSKIKNILITRLDNIGDMVLTTSFIKNIKYNFPNSKITILCRPCQKTIIKNFEYIDNIIVYDAFWFDGKEGLKKLFKIIFNNFKVFDLSFELHGELFSNIINFMLSNYRVGFGIRGGKFLLNKSIFFNWNNGENIVKHQNKQIKSIGGKIKYNNLELFIEKNIKTIEKKENIKNIVIHTGVSAKAREYPILQWIKLIENIKDEYRVIIIDTDKRKLNIFKNKGYETYIPKSINELIKLISDFDLLIGLESLSSHIGASVGTPTISIYSATTPKGLFFPYGKKLVVLRNEKCKLIECGLGKCDIGYPSNCMKNIKVELIEQKIKQLID